MNQCQNGSVGHMGMIAELEDTFNIEQKLMILSIFQVLGMKY